MAIKPQDYYVNANAATPSYPNGSIKNDDIPGDESGTLVDAALQNDMIGFGEALMAEAGVTPNGAPDTALSSDRLTALKKLSSNRFDDYSDMISHHSTKPFSDGDNIFITSDKISGQFKVIYSASHSVTSTSGVFINLDGDFYAERMLTNGDSVFLDWWGVSDTVDSTSLVQDALDNFITVYFSVPFTHSSDLWLRDGQTFRGVGDNALIIPTDNAQLRCEKGDGWRSFTSNATYYRDDVSPTALFTRTTSDIMQGEYSVVVNNVAGLEVGDYVFIFNGYCDHWRILEQSTSVADHNSDESELAAGEIMQVRSISGLTVTFEEPVYFNYPTTVQLYGGIADENARAAYTGYNEPYILKLEGCSNLNVGSFKYDDSANSGSGFFKIYISFEHLRFSTISDIVCTKGNRGLMLSKKCFNNSIENIKVSTSAGNCIRFEEFCSNNTVNNCNLQYTSGADAALLLNLRCNNNVINNITVIGDYTESINTIGVYINGSFGNQISNITGRNLQAPVAIYFDAWDNTVRGVNGNMCAMVAISYFARRNNWSDMHLTGFMGDRFEGQEETSFLMYYAKDDNVDGCFIRSDALLGIKLQNTERINITKTLVEGHNNGVRISGNTQNAETSIDNCVIEATNVGVNIIHDDPDDMSVKQILITRNKISGSNVGVNMKQVKFVTCENNKEIISDGKVFNLDYASFYKIRGNVCVGNGTAVGVDFSPTTNSEYLSNHGLMESNTFNSVTTVYDTYITPALNKSGGSYGFKISVLSAFPDIREFVYIDTTPNLTTSASWAEVSRVPVV